MAVVTPVVGTLLGANTRSFQITATDATPSVTNANLISGQPAGPLLTFLSTVFANEAAADLAFRSACGRIDLRQTGGALSTTSLSAKWVAAGTLPALLITGTTSIDMVLEVTIATVQSTNQ